MAALFFPSIIAIPPRSGPAQALLRALPAPFAAAGGPEAGTPEGLPALISNDPIDQKRSAFITLPHARAKSSANFWPASSLA
jgi:hypothetical protein